MSEKTIDSKPLPRGEELRIALQDYRGRTYLHARRWYTVGTELKPGKGLAIDVRDLPWLRKALDSAQEAALQQGLLAEEDFELVGVPVPAQLTA